MPKDLYVLYHLTLKTALQSGYSFHFKDQESEALSQDYTINNLKSLGSISLSFMPFLIIISFTLQSLLECSMIPVFLGQMHLSLFFYLQRFLAVILQFCKEEKETLKN